jgi:hypothetical protein
MVISTIVAEHENKMSQDLGTVVQAQTYFVERRTSRPLGSF